MWFLCFGMKSSEINKKKKKKEKKDFSCRERQKSKQYICNFTPMLTFTEPTHTHTQTWNVMKTVIFHAHIRYSHDCMIFSMEPSAIYFIVTNFLFRMNIINNMHFHIRLFDFYQYFAFYFASHCIKHPNWLQLLLLFGILFCFCIKCSRIVGWFYFFRIRSEFMQFTLGILLLWQTHFWNYDMQILRKQKCLSL